MKHTHLVLASVVTAALAAQLPAHAADVCLQFDGASCALSGDLGFFRFMGARLPRTPRRAVGLHGRACGTSEHVTGTAVRNPSGSIVGVGATFVCDGVPGVIKAEISPADTAVGSVHIGRASYGAFTLDTSCTVTIVACNTEPGT